MEEYLKTYIHKIEEELKNRLPIKNNDQGTIYKACAHSLFAGGKRLRPVFCLEFCKICGGEEEDAMPLACAIEMTHTASLIHDDLPCMDDDDFRRGKPTNHKVFGEAMAVLAGDTLFVQPYETVLTDPVAKKHPKRTIQALALLAKSTGTEGMMGGQVIDIESEDKKIPKEKLLTLQKLKTGALFECACVMGCIMAGASETEIAAARLYAQKLGLAFQIKDDILDVEGDQAVLGKPIGSDSQNNKSTFVSAFGIEKAKEMVKSLTDEAIEAAYTFKQHEFIIFLANLLIDRNK